MKEIREINTREETMEINKDNKHGNATLERNT